MGTILITAALQPVSGLVKDQAVNNWVVYHPALDPTPGNTLNWVGPINNFYSDLQIYLAKSLKRGPASILYKLYKIDGFLGGGNHGSPIATDSGSITGVVSGSNDLPAEVSVVLTTRGTGWDGVQVEAPDGADPGIAPDRPRQRHSGRLFLGPLSTTVIGTDGYRPDSTFLTNVRNAFRDSRQDWLANGMLPHVWSRKDATTRAVAAVQTDDAYDTQRRRGLAPTVRTTLAL